MEIIEIKVGMNVKYGNQKWKGIVMGIEGWYNDMVLVSFEGDEAIEEIESGYLRPF